MALSRSTCASKDRSRERLKVGAAVTPRQVPAPSSSLRSSKRSRWRDAGEDWDRAARVASSGRTVKGDSWTSTGETPGGKSRCGPTRARRRSRCAARADSSSCTRRRRLCRSALRASTCPARRWSSCSCSSNCRRETWASWECSRQRASRPCVCLERSTSKDRKEQATV